MSDLLQLHDVVSNDRWASRIVLEWQSEDPLALVEVVPFAETNLARRSA